MTNKKWTKTLAGLLWVSNAGSFYLPNNIIHHASEATKAAKEASVAPKSPHRGWGVQQADEPAASKTALRIFSIKFQDDGKKDDEDEDEHKMIDPDLDTEDFSLFMEGLKQWPLFPTDEPEEPEEALRSSGRYRGVNPFGNFFRLEAILDLATSSDSDDEARDSSSNNETYFSNIISAADQIVKVVSAREATTVADILDDDNNAVLEDTVRFLENSTQTKPKAGRGFSAGAIVKDASARIEYLLTEASSVLSKNSVQDLLIRASRVFDNNGTTTSVDDVIDNIVNVTTKVAEDQGLDAQFAADRARETTNYAANMLTVANSLFGAGYAYGAKSGRAESVDSPLVDVLSIQDSRPLFADSPSARRIDPFQYKNVVTKGAEMGTLAGAIYENPVPKAHKLGHSMVANGTTADVSWMVTDSLDCESSYVEASSAGETVQTKPVLVRTITIRGFDASDESVDREGLLNIICKAAGEQMSPTIPNILFHTGLLQTARAIYDEVKQYIAWASPNHKLVFNGHSIGGSLSILLLFLFTIDKGAGYVEERVLRVFTHGSPPICYFTSPATSPSRKPPPAASSSKPTNADDDMYRCSILEAFGLPQTMVYGYVQPYDPIVRFLTEYDPLYPLVDDLGQDEVTLYSTGPPRSLRPVTRALFQSWDGWPEFRDHWKGTNQKYQSVGIQHMLLPEPLRYLNDRFVSPNVGVPPTESIVRISSKELLPALSDAFPLDVFQISLIPQAVRSFLHHFFPAYDFTIANYAAKLEKDVSRPSEKERTSRRILSIRSTTSPEKAVIMEQNRSFSI